MIDAEKCFSPKKWQAPGNPTGTCLITSYEGKVLCDVFATAAKECQSAKTAQQGSGWLRDRTQRDIIATGEGVAHAVGVVADEPIHTTVVGDIRILCETAKGATDAIDAIVQNQEDQVVDLIAATGKHCGKTAG